MNHLMRARVAIELVMGTALLLSPLWVPKSNRRSAVIPMVLGAAGLFTAAMAQVGWPCDENGGFTPSREMSEAVVHLE
jgi:hypothetical protein